MPTVIYDRLVSKIRASLPGQSMDYHDGTIVFAAAHQVVGDLKIYLDDDEVTVMVGDGHFHMGFNHAMMALPSSEATDRLAERIVNELREVFENRRTFRIRESRFLEIKQRGWWRRIFAVFRFRTCGWTGPL